jgi:hypothetical protein
MFLSVDVRRMLLCRVGTGRSFVLDDIASERVLPSGYDSLYVHAPVDTDGDGKVSAEEYDVAATHGGRPAEAYSHKYIILDSAQVLPAYLVQFRYTPQPGGDRMCDSCETHPATLSCAADNANLCDDCDERIHSVNKLVSRHTRVPLRSESKFKSGLVDAQSRVGDALALFGSTAVDTARKMIADMTAEYERAFAESQSPDPSLVERKRGVSEALAAIEERAHAVHDNATAVEEAIYQKMQELLQQLQDETAKKITALLAEELELRRQLEQLEWADSFIPVMQDSLPPAEFVAAWRQHVAYRSHLQLEQAAVNKANCRALQDVQADLELSGQFTVVCSRTSREAGGVLNPSGASLAQAFSTNSRLLRGPGYLEAGAGRSGFNYAPNQQSVLALPDEPATAVGPSASGYDLNAMWSSQLREHWKVSGGAASTDLPPLPAPYPGMLDEQQVQAAGAMSRAREAVVAAATRGYPDAPASVAPSVNNYVHFGVGALPAIGESKSEDSVVAASFKDRSSQRPPHLQEEPSPRPPSSVSTYSDVFPYDGGAKPVSVAPPRAPSVAPVTLPARLQQKLKQFSMKAEAERRIKRQPGWGGVAGLSKFVDSKIIMGDAAAVLFACLPPSQPGQGPEDMETHLLYRSTDYPSPNIRDFAERFRDASLPPTVILVKSGSFVFGGYAADSWIFDGQYGGNPRSFLFSVTHDCKIPYHGRVKGPEQESDAETARQYEQHQRNAYIAAMGYNPFVDFSGRADVAHLIPKLKPWVRHDCIRATDDSVQFGLKDLVLSVSTLCCVAVCASYHSPAIVQSDFSECSSALEYSYGIGMTPSSPETTVSWFVSPLRRGDVCVAVVHVRCMSADVLGWESGVSRGYCGSLGDWGCVGIGNGNCSPSVWSNQCPCGYLCGRWRWLRHWILQCWAANVLTCVVCCVLCCVFFRGPNETRGNLVGLFHAAHDVGRATVFTWAALTRKLGGFGVDIQ